MPAVQTTRSRPPASDVALASLLATAAGRLLVELRAAAPPPQGLGDEADRRSQRLLADMLAEHRPRDCVLSEEGEDDEARLEADRVWIVDPLDGTREYAEGRHDWAVHVALWERGQLVAGAVALPDHGVTVATDGTHRLPEVPAGRALRVAVSRSRPPSVVARLAELLPLEIVPMGSAGYKAMAVLRGDVDAYVHAGGQYEWDSAAPVAVARAAGAVATRLDGTPLVYNRPDPLLPDLVVVRSDRSEALRQALDLALMEST